LKSNNGNASKMSADNDGHDSEGVEEINDDDD
jgi:hypothetical protein